MLKRTLRTTSEGVCVIASESQYIANKGLGAPGRLAQTMLIAMTAPASASTVKFGPVAIPVGSWITAIRTSTPVAISGSPTSVSLNIGTTDGGSEIMAASDLKAAQNSSATIVAAFDLVGNNVGNIYPQLVTVGGTAMTGVINLFFTVHSPIV